MASTDQQPPAGAVQQPPETSANQPDENAIRETLIGFINRLVQLALVALGIWVLARRQKTVQVTAVWKIEPWFEMEIPGLAKRIGLGPEAEATLRTSLGQLVEDLEKVVASGGTDADVRQAAIAFRDQWIGWARKVATTESTRIASEAILASPAARQPGAQVEWVTSHDAKVRTTHHLVDGSRVPVGGSFVVGDSLMRYPGDPLGDPQEIINCRCSPKIVPPGGRT